jgi:type IV pilus assembly protein PilA
MQDTITRLRAKKGDEGFTLIELLVVVVIIGVLVAIAVPVYLNYRQGAADKSAQSDVRGAISAVEQWYSDNGNAYPATHADETTSFSLDSTLTKHVTLSDNTKMSYILAPVTGTAGHYLICATNTGGTGKIYLYDSSKGGSVKAPTPAVASLTTCT